MMKHRYELEYEFVNNSGLIEKFDDFKKRLNTIGSQVRLTAYSEFDNCPQAKSIRFSLVNDNEYISGYENAFNVVKDICDELGVTDRPRFNYRFDG